MGLTAGRSVADRVEQRPVSTWLFVWLTVAATGGPLALGALYVPGVLGAASGSAGVIAVLGVALFVPPILVWLGYSRQIVGPGGLYAFVEAGAGRTVARVQAGLWIVSYVLYLIYTTTYIAYDVLPSVFPGAAGIRPLMQMLTAGVVVAVVTLPVRRTVLVVAGIAVAQLALLAGLAAVEVLRTTGAAPAAAGPRTVLVAGGNLSILFICSGLPLFLGGETHGGSRSVRSGLAGGWAIAAVATMAVTIPMATVAPSLLSAALPGAAVADDAGLPTLATAIGIGVVASVIAVMVAEYLALSRLVHALTGSTVRGVSQLIAVVLVAGSAVSLVQPERVYDDLLKPSLVALWLSQILVFASYPIFVARRSGDRPGALALAIAVGAAASGLMLFGLWSTIVNQLGT